MGHRKRAAEIKERAAEIFSVLKSVPAKACSKKCTAGSKVRGLGGEGCIWPQKEHLVSKVNIEGEESVGVEGERGEMLEERGRGGSCVLKRN